MFWDSSSAASQAHVVDKIEAVVEGSAGNERRSIQYLRRDSIAVPPARRGSGGKPQIDWSYVVASISMHEPNLARLVAWFWLHAWRNNFFESTCKTVPEQVCREIGAHIGEDLFGQPATEKRHVEQLPSWAPAFRYSQKANITGMLLENVLLFPTIEFQAVAGLLAPLAATLDRVPKIEASILEGLPCVEAVVEEYGAWEGLMRRTTLSEPERSAALRRMALQLHGHRCQVCGFDFAETYGESYARLMHVHHLQPLSKGQRLTDLKRDLVPVCPNCHAVLHSQDPPLSIEACRALLQKRG